MRLHSYSQGSLIYPRCTGQPICFLVFENCHQTDEVLQIARSRIRNRTKKRRIYESEYEKDEKLSRKSYVYIVNFNFFNEEKSLRNVVKRKQT